jgi:DNA-binding NtrC family response regulator
LLPPAVTGSPVPGKPVEVAGLDFEALTRLVVERGIEAARDDSTDLHQQVVDRVEKELIAQVLTGCRFVQTKAAARLGINRNTLHKKLKDYDLESLGSSEGSAEEAS